MKTGAAGLLEQTKSAPEQVVGSLAELVENETARGKMQAALAPWHTPHAAAQIAENMLSAGLRGAGQKKTSPVPARDATPLKAAA